MQNAEYRIGLLGRLLQVGAEDSVLEKTMVRSTRNDKSSRENQLFSK